MSYIRQLTTGVACLIAFATMIIVAPPADAATTAQFTGHRCQTVDRSNTHENTVEAVRRASLAGPGTWCESDIWGLSDGTDGVWHDPTVGGAAASSSLPAGVTKSTPTKSLTQAQFDQIRTTGGSPTATPVEMVQAAARYGIPRIVFEVRNALRQPALIANAAAATGVSVVMYKIPNAQCVVSVRGWNGLLGVKWAPNSTCTPQQFASQGVDLVTLNITALSENSCAKYRAITSLGMETIAYGATQANYPAYERCGGRRVMVNDPAASRATW